MATVTSSEYCERAAARTLGLRQRASQRSLIAQQQAHERKSERGLRTAAAVAVARSPTEVVRAYGEAARRQEEARRMLSWLTVVQMVNFAAALREVSVVRQAEMARRAVELRHAAVIYRRWRLRMLRRRLHLIISRKNVLKRRIFWWRFRHRIARKQKSTALLLIFLRHTAKQSKVANACNRFVLVVKNVQRLWRRYWFVLWAQSQVFEKYWAHVERKKKREVLGNSAEIEEITEAERKIRYEVVRADLRQRKVDYRVACAEWTSKMGEYENLLRLQEMMSSARALLGQSAVAKIQRATRRRRTLLLAQGDAQQRLGSGAESPSPSSQSPEMPTKAAAAPSPSPSPPPTRTTDNAPVHPGPPPRFGLFVPEEHLAKLAARAKARMRTAGLPAGAVTPAKTPSKQS